MCEVANAAWLSVAISASAVAVAAAPGVPLAALLGLSSSRIATILRIAARVVMSFPTVLVGLLIYSLLTRHGPLGPLGLLFTPQAIVAGEIVLAFPLVVALGDPGRSEEP